MKREEKFEISGQFPHSKHVIENCLQDKIPFYDSPMNHHPDYYRPERIGTLFYPDFRGIFQEARQDERTEDKTPEKPIVNLLLIDMQVDFCHENGSLYVPGAEEDIRRVIEFIFRHAANIQKIGCSLDTHLPHQIFHSSWWEDSEGMPPSPLSVLNNDDIGEQWQPQFHEQWSQEYVQKLEKKEQKELTIWPYHVLQGSVGNLLDQELYSAVFWHAALTGTNPEFLVKGTEPKTEHYSVMAPEIIPDDADMHETKPRLHGFVDSADALIVAGEAKSHCVQETLDDFVAMYEDDHPAYLEKIYVLEDCTSPVQHPEIDFDRIASEAFERFARKGINIVDSTQDLQGIRY